MRGPGADPETDDHESAVPRADDARRVRATRGCRTGQHLRRPHAAVGAQPCDAVAGGDCGPGSRNDAGRHLLTGAGIDLHRRPAAAVLRMPGAGDDVGRGSAEASADDYEPAQPVVRNALRDEPAAVDVEGPRI